MKGKQLAIVLVLLVVFGAVALFLNRRNSATWSSTATISTGKLLDFQLNDVSQATIKEASGEVNLVKKEDVWRVKERADYPAAFDKVSALLRKLWELHPVQDVKIGPSQLGRLQLTEPSQGSSSGTLVDLKGSGDKRLAALLLGKKYVKNPDQPASEGGGIPAGRYVMGEDGSNRVFLVSDTFDEVQTKPEQWLSRDFIKVENPKSITVTGTSPAMNWKLTRDSASAPWKLADAKTGEELDNSKAAGIAATFASAVFTDVLPPDGPVAETGLDKASTVHIETLDGFSYDFRIGKLTGEAYPVLVSVRAELPKERTPAAEEKPEDKTKHDEEFQAKQKQLTEKLASEQKLENRPYLISKGMIAQFLKERSSLMAEKKSSPSPGVTAPPGNPKQAPPMKPSSVTPRPIFPPAKSSPSVAKSPK